MNTPRKEFSRATKRAAWERSGGRCECVIDGLRCDAPVDTGCFIYEHLDPVWISDDASLDNCGVFCLPCAKAKTRKDVADIAKVKRIRDKRIKALASKRPFRGWRRFDGTVVYANKR